MQTYAIGAGVILNFTFESASGIPTDPVAVTVKVVHPDRTTVDVYHLADLTRNGAGDYSIRIVVGEPGRWTYRAESDGALQGATLDQTFIVEETAT